jgi:hypothetical protein
MIRQSKGHQFAGKRSPVFLAFLAVLFLLLPGFSRDVDSAELTAATLLYFQGFGQNNSVRLEWGTGTEFDTAGFRLVRSTAENGAYINLNQIGFISGEGDGVLGADYVAVDSDGVTNGTTYWYKLIEIEFDGREIPTGPIPVTAGVATPTATSTPTPTSSPTPQNSDQGSSPTPEPEESQATSTPTPTQITANVTVPQSGVSAATPVPSSPTPGTSSGNSGAGSSQPGSNTGSTSQSNVVEAAAPDLSSGARDYPAPENSDSFALAASISGQDAAYPGPSSNDQSSTPESYPAVIGSGESNNDTQSSANSAADSSVIGSANASGLSPKSADESDSSESSSAGSVVLWLGFGAALLIFGAGVIGSIIYFSRQRMQGR